MALRHDYDIVIIMSQYALHQLNQSQLGFLPTIFYVEHPSIKYDTIRSATPEQNTFLVWTTTVKYDYQSYVFRANFFTKFF